MIAFDFECSKGHVFEGWFDNLKSFEEQDSHNMINCPYCNDTNITRILSPVSMKTSPAVERERESKPIDYEKLVNDLSKYIHDEFEDLGTDFTKEALKIHYGVAEERNIRGSATENEEKLLVDEGIRFFKFPALKIDHSKKD